MQPTVQQRLDVGGRALVPFTLTLCLMLFSMAPTQIPGFSHVTPMYSLAAVYFWTIYRPDLIGYGTVFAIGLLEDLLVGTPLGSSALILLLCQYLVLRQQKFFHAKSFGVFWLSFGVIVLGAGLIKWTCVGMVARSGLTPFGDLIASVLLTAAAYPVIAWLLAKTQMTLLAEP